MPVNTKSKKAEVKEGVESGGIVVTSQQSRFHTDANDAPSSKDIDVRDLTISVGGREIVDDVKLALKEGGRYAMVGRNGLGKSTILRALAERRIPGVALNLRILLLGQTRVDTDETEGESNGSVQQTVIQHVISSDRKRERLMKDIELLSSVLETKADSAEAVAKAARRLRLEQAKRELDDARLIASRRSGARGSKARQILVDKEKEFEDLKQLAEAQGSVEDVQSDIDSAIEMLERFQFTLDGMDASTTEARARSILIGLAFSDAQIDGPLSNLSGGWQTRASLAAALVQQTDVLLLDEPTNFLDLPAVIWLQHYLSNTLSETTTLVVTTHDRDFADAIADHLLILRQQPPKTIETFNGILTDYVAEKHRQIRRMTKMSAANDRKQKHMESTIAKSITAAKRTGDDKKLKQAASRRKKIEERSGLEVGLSGGRFKLSRDLAGWHTKNRADIEIPEFDPPVNITFLGAPPELRNTGTLVSAENVSFTYPKTKTQILDNITLTIHPHSRTAIVGLNGSGKSTLVNLITSNTYKPTSGTLNLHPTARIAHYTQHHPTALANLTSLPNTPTGSPPPTPLSYLSSLHPTLPEQTLRATLSGLSLHSTHQTTPLQSLSGGQLVRVSLATCLLPHPAHLLVLDEPTTHLDSDTIISLISALKTYPGALLLVSHDRFFIRCVIEGQSAKGHRDSENPDDDLSSSSDEDGIDETGYGGGGGGGGGAGKSSNVLGRIFRMTKTGKLLDLPGGMDSYEDLIVKQLAKKGIEVS